LRGRYRSVFPSREREREKERKREREKERKREREKERKRDGGISVGWIKERRHKNAFLLSLIVYTTATVREHLYPGYVSIAFTKF